MAQEKSLALGLASPANYTSAVGETAERKVSNFVGISDLPVVLTSALSAHGGGAIAPAHMADPLSAAAQAAAKINAMLAAKGKLPKAATPPPAPMVCCALMARAVRVHARSPLQMLTIPPCARPAGILAHKGGGDQRRAQPAAILLDKDLLSRGSTLETSGC